MAVSVTINGAKRVTVGAERMLLIDLTIGTSHQQIPFDEAQLLSLGSTTAMVSYISTQALKSVSAATAITTVPTGFPDIRSTTSVTGSMPMAAFGVTQRTVTVSGAVTTSDYLIFADATAAPIVLTFPTAVGAGGQRWEVQKIDSSANTVTLTPNGAETIAGAATAVLTLKGQVAVITSDNANLQRTPNVVAQVGASQAGVASIADAPAKAAVTALQAALFAESLVTNPA